MGLTAFINDSGSIINMNICRQCAALSKQVQIGYYIVL